MTNDKLQIANWRTKAPRKFVEAFRPQIREYLGRLRVPIIEGGSI